MGQGICYLVGAGEDYGLDFQPKAEDFVIGVDAGYRLLRQNDMPVHLAIGDFDTLGCRPDFPNTIVLNTEKDDTDMQAAVREGIGAGYRQFRIYCGTGGRLDHTLANLQLLAELSENGRQGILFDRDCAITAITDSILVFPEKCSGYVSVFSHSGQAEGVYLRGLKYELEDALLRNTYPLGISNEFTGKESSISVRRGTLLVFSPRGCPVPELLDR